MVNNIYTIFDLTSIIIYDMPNKKNIVYISNNSLGYNIHLNIKCKLISENNWNLKYKININNLLINANQRIYNTNLNIKSLINIIFTDKKKEIKTINNNIIFFKLINNKKLATYFDNNCLCSNNKNCYLVQNYNELILNLPNELNNLSYGIYPTNEVYNISRLVYNRLINYFPQVIFYPENYIDVSYLIKNIFKYNCKFTIRCGGHAYEPSSVSNGIIIDVSKLNNIDYNYDNNTIICQSGVKLGKLVDFMNENKIITPTGHNVCVGISGLSLAGGKGRLSRKYGLTCDNIISCKMINYKGDLININENENSDLLYGIRGAGTNNFGLILELNIKGYNDIFFKEYNITWDWNSIKCLEILTFYIDVINNNNDINITYDFLMITDKYSSNSSRFSVTITKYFDNNNIDNNFNEYKKFDILNPSDINYNEGFYSQNLSWVDYGNGRIPPFSKIKSTMLYKNLNKKYLNILVNSINEIIIDQNNNSIYQLNITELGGKVSINKNINSCYFSRDATSILSYFIQWDDNDKSDKNKTFINEIWNNFSKYSSYLCFPNLIDYDLQNYMYSYYGTLKNQNKLITLKKKYDPNNIFNWKQSIPI